MKPLGKVLRYFVEAAETDTVEEALKKYEDGKGLHRVIQRVVTRLEDEVEPGTIRFYLWLLGSFLKYHDLPWEKVVGKVKKPKKATVRVDKIPSVRDLQMIIMKTKSPRLALLVQLLCQTGMRLNEALRLKLEHIDLENNVIHLSLIHISEPTRPY